MRTIRLAAALTLLVAVTLSGCAAPGLQPQTADTATEQARRADLERELSMYSD